MFFRILNLTSILVVNDSMINHVDIAPKQIFEKLNLKKKFVLDPEAKNSNLSLFGLPNVYYTILPQNYYGRNFKVI